MLINLDTFLDDPANIVSRSNSSYYRYKIKMPTARRGVELCNREELGFTAMNQ